MTTLLDARDINLTVQEQENTKTKEPNDNGLVEPNYEAFSKIVPTKGQQPTNQGIYNGKLYSS
jgi:hypothetical protein